MLKHAEAPRKKAFLNEKNRKIARKLKAESLLIYQLLLLLQL